MNQGGAWGITVREKRSETITGEGAIIQRTLTALNVEVEKIAMSGQGKR